MRNHRYLYLSVVLAIISLHLTTKNIEQFLINYGTVSIRTEGQITPKHVDYIIDDLKDGEILRFASFWKETRVDIITDSVFYNVPTIYILGAFSSLFNGEMLHGEIPIDLDEKKCVISSALANRIFGSSSVLGLQIRLFESEQIKYNISGVIQSDKEFLFLSEGKKSSYDNIEFFLNQNPTDVYEVSQSICRQYGIEPTIIIEQDFFTNTIRLFLFMPIFLLLIFHLLIYITHNRIAALLVTKAIVLMPYALLLAKLLGWNGQFPSKLIPSKWSNFEFWQAQCNSWLSRFHGYLTMTTTIKDEFQNLDLPLYIISGIILPLCTSVICLYLNKLHQKLEADIVITTAITCILILCFTNEIPALSCWLLYPLHTAILAICDKMYERFNT